MGKKQSKGKSKYNSKVITSLSRIQETMNKEDLIEIHAEAYYRAMKKVKNEENPSTVNKSGLKVLKIIAYLLFKPQKLVTLKEEGQMADGLLCFLLSMTLAFIGFMLRLTGFLALIYLIYSQLTKQAVSAPNYIYSVLFILLLICIGGMFTAASKDIEELKDREYIYKFSGSLMAMLAFIVSIIALLK